MCWFGLALEHAYEKHRVLLVSMPLTPAAIERIAISRRAGFSLAVTQRTVEQISQTGRRLKVHVMLMSQHQSSSCNGVQPSRDVESNVEATRRRNDQRRHRRRTTARSCRGPASVRRPSRLLFRQRDGVTAVADRGAVLRTLLAATAAPLRLWHAGPGRAAQATSVRRTEVSVCPEREAIGISGYTREALSQAR